MINQDDLIQLFVSTPFLLAYGLIVGIALVGLWGLTVVSMTATIAPNASPIDVSRITVTGLGVLVNLLFSVGLLYLYFRMMRIQSKQTDLMKAGHRPELFVNNYGPTDNIRDQEGEDGIYLDLVNLGESAVHDLRLAVDLTFSSESYQPKLKEVPLYKLENDQQVPQQHLNPTNKNTRFTCGIFAHIDGVDDDVKHEGPLSDVLDTLYRDEVERIRIRIFVIGRTNVNNLPIREDVLDYVVDLNSRMGYPEIEREGLPYSIASVA